MDSSKIDKDGSYQFCSMKEADIIVSDFHLSESFKEECESMGGNDFISSSPTF